MQLQVNLFLYLLVEFTLIGNQVNFDKSQVNFYWTSILNAKNEVNFGTHFLYKGEVNFAKVKLTLIGSQLNFDKKSS